MTDLGHISSVTYVCHPLWFVCGHRKGILMSRLTIVTHFKEMTGVFRHVVGGAVPPTRRAEKSGPTGL